MSVIATNAKTGRFVLFTKGADDTVLPKSISSGLYNASTRSARKALETAETIADEPDDSGDAASADAASSSMSVDLGENLRLMQDGLTRYSNEGLRTLVIACHEMDEIEMNDMLVDIDAAETALEDREEKKGACYERLEDKLIALGVTGIEDLLQDNVCETITYLRDCGMKVWMITGDKPQTAINIGRSTGIIGSDTPLENVLVLEGTSSSEVRQSIADCEARIAAASASGSTTGSGSPCDFALCVSGRVFSLITSVSVDLTDLDAEKTTLVKPFVHLATQMDGVIACRVTPKQKAEIVNIMKKATGECALAIGDGGNDVIMIQQSDVGIGIVGKEGQQAARASDYVISEFQYLKRLCCVHGVSSVSRSWTVALYSIYKSVVFCAIQSL